jgi:ribulose-bisphosphate carboxylase small chain
VNECRKQFGDHYIRVIAFDDTHGWESMKISFIVNRPKEEPGFHVSREEVKGRSMRYSIKSYATDKPEGKRY